MTTTIESSQQHFHQRPLRQHHQDINGSIRSSSSSDSSISSSSPTTHKKKTATQCIICGKRLFKLAKWRNYLILPCRCQHTYCKRCITERLQCRQKVMGEATYDLFWTFPCPGSAQCGQELHVDWSKGQSYSKNLVARDLGSHDDSWDPDEATLDADLQEGSVFSGHQYHDVSGVLREVG